MSTPITLGYWSIRGRAGPLRLLLKYVNANYVDKLYEYGTETGKANWAKDKFSMGMDFPNLPYLIDNDVKLTQTLAILRYLGRKYKLDGKDEEAKQRIDLLEQQLTDVATLVWTFIFKQTKTEEDKTTFQTSLKKHLDDISKFLGSRPYAAGEISYVDFFFYESIRFINVQEISKGEVNKIANLDAFLKRFEMLPQLAEYLKEANAKPGF